MNRTIFVIATIALQITFLRLWITRENLRIQPGHGKSIRVRTIPVDPRDLLRGQYIRLRYPFSDGDIEAPRDSRIWVTLREKTIDGTRFHEPYRYSKTKPKIERSDDVLIRGIFKTRDSLSFGIEKYFVPFGTDTPKVDSITVRLRIGNDYQPRIEKVYVNGRPWP